MGRQSSQALGQPPEWWTGFGQLLLTPETKEMCDRVERLSLPEGAGSAGRDLCDIPTWAAGIGVWPLGT